MGININYFHNYERNWSSMVQDHGVQIHDENDFKFQVRSISSHWIAIDQFVFPGVIHINSSSKETSLFWRYRRKAN